MNSASIPACCYALCFLASSPLCYSVFSQPFDPRNRLQWLMRSRTSRRSQGTLVAGEVALAFVLLVGAGLLIRTFVAIRTTDLGYNPHNVLTNFLALPPSPDGGRTAGAGVYARVRERVSALPGIRAVATSSSLPMFGVSISMDVH